MFAQAFDKAQTTAHRGAGAEGDQDTLGGGPSSDAARGQSSEVNGETPAILDGGKVNKAVTYNRQRWPSLVVGQLRQALGLSSGGEADEQFAQTAAGYQKENALKIDGMVGPVTADALKAGDAADAPTLTRTQTRKAIAYNQRNLPAEDLKSVQSFLQVPQSGASDAATALAAALFQAGAALVRDGMIGAKTLSGLLLAGLRDLGKTAGAPPRLTEAQIAHAIKKDRGITQHNKANLNKGLIFAVRDQLRLPIVSKVDREMVLAIADFQLAHTIAPMDGVLTAPTLAAMKSQGMLSSDKKVWALRDAEDRVSIQAEEVKAREQGRQAQQRGDVSGVRKSIVQLAESQVGKVNSANRGDGAKYGWARISRFYEVACGAKDPNVNHPGTKRANTFPGNSKPGQKTGEWSWCGIFAVWAVKSVTGRGHWHNGEQGYDRQSKDTVFSPTDGAQPGDIIRFQHKAHRSVLKEAPKPGDDHVVTVDGNGDYQNVSVESHDKGGIVDWLRTVSP